MTLTRMLLRAVAVVIPALLAVPANGATVNFMSWFYSADHFVPHLHYDGPVQMGDLEKLEAVFDAHIQCDADALPAEGGNCAVLTLRSPGGNYIEGLKLAQFLRDNRIATVIEAGSECYSACAFAFLGGTGYSSQDGIGVYVDRVVEPEAILGFHAPYFASDALDGLVAEFGLDEVLGASRDDISLMVRQLVNWNVDENILGYIVSMGPEETYDVVTGEDYFLTRTALPVSPLDIWGNSVSDPFGSACSYLLAVRDNDFPSVVASRIADSTLVPIGVDSNGTPISGFRLGPDNPLGVTFCGLPSAQLDEQGDADIALYTGPGINGDIRPMLTYFHRPQGWSSIDAGGRASRSIFQKGAMTALFLDITENVASGDSSVHDYLNGEKYLTPAILAGFDAPYLTSSLPIQPLFETGWSRTSTHQGVTIVEQVGTRRFFERVRAEVARLPFTPEHRSVTDAGFILAGTDPATGKALVWMGFLEGDEASVVRLDAPGPDTPLTALYPVACSLTFKSTAFTCG